MPAALCADLRFGNHAMPRAQLFGRRSPVSRLASERPAILSTLARLVVSGQTTHPSRQLSVTIHANMFLGDPMLPPKSFSMIREFHLADWFTLCNAFCGVGALFSAMTYLQTAELRHLYFACGLIPLALLFDVLDGRIARWRQQSSALGRELDSLADIISFGVAPAVIAYACGMQGLYDRIVLLFFVACGVSRLARYNITAQMLAAGEDKVKYFEGTPIPTSLLLVIVLAVAVWQEALGDALWFGVVYIGGFQLHPLVLMFALSGSLMISRIRIPKL
jgi:CDP-diacylglycerol--serine O-phosphatidyltransferase